MFEINDENKKQFIDTLNKLTLKLYSPCNTTHATFKIYFG